VESSLNRVFYLPRLPRQYYQGDAVVFWTLTIRNKATGWLTPQFHSHFREFMLHTAAREGLLCPIYCVMPDHLHLVWMGLRKDTDQRTAMAFFRTHLEPNLAPAKFQHQAQDRVLREEQRRGDAFADVCANVANNPVRAGLIEQNGKWPYTGSVVPGYPRLDPAHGQFWSRFWKLYRSMQDKDAGDIIRPPLD
jgi:REP element-mobilizing transposase RayT